MLEITDALFQFGTPVSERTLTPSALFHGGTRPRYGLQGGSTPPSA